MSNAQILDDLRYCAEAVTGPDQIKAESNLKAFAAGLIGYAISPPCQSTAETLAVPSVALVGNPTQSKNCKFRVTPRVLAGLVFTVVSLETSLSALQAHKRPHKPAIERCKEALAVLSSIHAAAFKVAKDSGLLTVLHHD